MKILLYILFLSLFSCGGGEGDGASGGGSNTAPPSQEYGKGSGYENLDKFKQAVARGEWGQYQFFTQYNSYKFNYIKSCQKLICFNIGQPTADHITVEKKGIVTNPLVSLQTIKNAVAGAVLNSTASYNSGTRQWTIYYGTEEFIFDPGYPLGGNPLYYKNPEGERFSIFRYEYDKID